MSVANIFSNIKHEESLKDDLVDRFVDLTRILQEIAGPFSGNAIIGSKWRRHNDIDEFTKDGIKVLRHLLSGEDAASRLAARLTRTIGTTVDKRCHDGTTTSMLLFAYLAIHALNTQTGNRRERFKRTHQWKKILTELHTEIEKFKITDREILEKAHEFGLTETSLADVRAAMAYHMAMISSKGDPDLAKKVSFVVKSCPKPEYGLFNAPTTMRETKELYTLEKQSSDIHISANLQNLYHFNYKNDTQYLSENAVVFMTGGDIVNGSTEAMFLNAFISQRPKDRADLSYFNTELGWEAYHEGKRNLVIIASMITEENLLTNIELFNQSHPECKIVVFFIQVHKQLATSLNKTLHYMSGVPTFQDVMYTDPSRSLIGLNQPEGLDPVRVHLLGNQLSLTNLYKKTGQVFHPFYEDETKFEPYTAFRLETESLLDMCLENITNVALENNEVTYLMTLYRALTTQDIYTLDVGGTAYEQVANRTVYEDAMGASLSAVTDGITLGGYAHLLRYVILKLQVREDPDGILTGIRGALENLIEDTLDIDENDFQTVIDSILDNLTNKWSYLVASPNDYLMGKDYIHVGELNKNSLSKFLECGTGVPVLTQAYAGYDEQFKRFGDVLPKMSNTAFLVDMRTREENDSD